MHSNFYLIPDSCKLIWMESSLSVKVKTKGPSPSYPAYGINCVTFEFILKTKGPSPWHPAYGIN